MGTVLKGGVTFNDTAPPGGATAKCGGEKPGLPFGLAGALADMADKLGEAAEASAGEIEAGMRAAGRGVSRSGLAGQLGKLARGAGGFPGLGIIKGLPGGAALTFIDHIIDQLIKGRNPFDEDGLRSLAVALGGMVLSSLLIMIFGLTGGWAIAAGILIGMGFTVLYDQLGQMAGASG
ncbi:MAG: hypothetical protein IT186_19565 [Acidobacteria bacterium]|nr:hypothetical protein [Acidobacteriota bacterium]MCG3194575.1 hypothetical protein [Thermoanaerobaculia bacterium]